MGAIAKARAKWRKTQNLLFPPPSQPLPSRPMPTVDSRKRKRAESESSEKIAKKPKPMLVNLGMKKKPMLVDPGMKKKPTVDVDMKMKAKCVGGILKAMPIPLNHLHLHTGSTSTSSNPSPRVLHPSTSEPVPLKQAIMAAKAAKERALISVCEAEKQKAEAEKQKAEKEKQKEEEGLKLMDQRRRDQMRAEARAFLESTEKIDVQWPEDGFLIMRDHDLLIGRTHLSIALSLIRSRGCSLPYFS